MRPLTTTLSRQEVIDRLGIPAEVIDALLESGRVLCRVTRGEMRIPLAQLEDFFRESLLAVYRAEPVADLAPLEAPDLGAPLGAPASGRPVRQPPAGVEETETGGEATAEPAGEDASVPEPVVALPPPPRPVDPEPHDTPDNRVAARFVPLRQISGIFGDIKFSVLQMSATGLRIRHSESLLPGDEAKVSFALLRSARSVVVRARVVWTSIARAGETRFSISGLRIIEHADRLERAIEMLNEAHELQPERRNRPRRANDALAMLDGVSDEEMALVTNAVQKFASDPVEASRWYSRARFALSDENVRRVAPTRPRDREEVLGVWEYLERKVDIDKISGVMRWMRAG
jgi:hypothetical protein